MVEGVDPKVVDESFAYRITREGDEEEVVLTVHAEAGQFVFERDGTRVCRASLRELILAEPDLHVLKVDECACIDSPILKDHEIAEWLSVEDEEETWYDLLINGREWFFDRPQNLTPSGLIVTDFYEHPEEESDIASANFCWRLFGGSDRPNRDPEGYAGLDRLGTLYRASNSEYDLGDYEFWRSDNERASVLGFIDDALFDLSTLVESPYLDDLSDEEVAERGPRSFLFGAHTVWANSQLWVMLPGFGFARRSSNRGTPVPLAEALKEWRPASVEFETRDGWQRLEVHAQAADDEAGSEQADSEAGGFLCIVALLDEEGCARLGSQETAWIALYEGVVKSRRVSACRVALVQLPGGGLAPGVAIDSWVVALGLVHAFGQPFFFVRKAGEFQIYDPDGEQLEAKPYVGTLIDTPTWTALAQRFTDARDRLTG